MFSIQQIQLLQKVIDTIEQRIKEEIKPDELAKISGYSPFHFYRVFHEHIGYTVMDYVVKRKLQHALFELVNGKKVIDIALEYGFETHSGFTKAFKRVFGSPPNLYRLHCPTSFPPKLDLMNFRQKEVGGIVMQPKIVQKTGFTIAGKTYTSRLDNVFYTRDAPAFWDQRIAPEEAIETMLYEQLAPKKHGEYCVNLNARETDNTFTYLFAVDCDHDDAKLPEGLKKLHIQPATYAVFNIPPVDVDRFVPAIKGTWKFILEDWLPQSSYEVDEQGYDFEYYDERCHDWIYEKITMEIYVPIKEKDKV